MFDLSIKKTIDAAADTKVKELIPHVDEKDGRARELDTHLNHALHLLFARIERGMTVEIKFVTPPSTADDATPETPGEACTQFVQLAEISPQLVFPPPAAEPILALPRSQATSAP